MLVFKDDGREGGAGGSGVPTDSSIKSGCFSELSPGPAVVERVDSVQFGGGPIQICSGVAPILVFSPRYISPIASNRRAQLAVLPDEELVVQEGKLLKLVDRALVGLLNESADINSATLMSGAIRTQLRKASELQSLDESYALEGCPGLVYAGDAIWHQFTDSAANNGLSEYAVDPESEQNNSYVDTIVQDFPGLRDAALLTLESLRTLLAKTTISDLEELDEKQLAKRVFTDLFELRDSGNKVILASSALPPFIIPFFGNDKVAGLILTSSVSGHLQNLLSGSEIPVAVVSPAVDKQVVLLQRVRRACRELHERFDGKYGVISVGENRGSFTDMNLWLSSKAESLGEYSQAEAQKIIIPALPHRTADSNYVLLDFQADTTKALTRIQAPGVGLGLVKSEFLALERAYKEHVPVWKLSKESIAESIGEFFQAASDISVTFRWIDPSADKLPAPDDKRILDNFRKAQIEAIVDLAKERTARGVVTQIMIPNWEGIDQLEWAWSIARNRNPEIGNLLFEFCPMVESRQGMRALGDQKEELARFTGRLTRICVGLGDFTSNCTGLERGHPEFKVPPARAIRALGVLKKHADYLKCELVLAGDMVGEAHLLPIWEGLEIRHLVPPASCYERVSGFIKMLNEEDCKNLVNHLRKDLQIVGLKERVRILSEYWKKHGGDLSELGLI